MRAWKPNHPQQLEAIEPKDLVRFARKVDVSHNGGCWTWKGNVDGKGYGRFWMIGRNHWAHRVAYVVFGGSIPDGYTIHHTCHNTSCVNPEHLELATLEDNSAERQARKYQTEPPF